MYKILILFCICPCLTACSSRTPQSPVVISEPRESSTPHPSPTPHINREEVTLTTGLRIVRREINLENEEWRYKVNVAYPEIDGIPNGRSTALNRDIRALVTESYQWLLHRPSKRDLANYARWEGVFNSVDLEYDVVLVNDELLSVYFIGYHYGIGAAHSVHESFTVNYDLRRHKMLSLSSLFKSKSRALKLISRKSLEDLAKKIPYLTADSVFADNLKPRTKNFESWNLTPLGLRINFDACKVAACADGDLQVEISFEQLREISGPVSVAVTRK